MIKDSGLRRNDGFSCFLLTVCSLFTLSGCSSSPHDMAEGGGPLTPMPGIVEPGDDLLMTVASDYIRQVKGPLHSRYEYSRVDLDGDGMRDGLVMFTFPHAHWCGWGGCTMLVLKAEDERFVPVSEMIKIRGPMVVAETRTNGWRDIVVRASGSNLSDRTVTMSFDGKRYPSDPMSQPVYTTQIASIPGTSIFP